MQGTYVSFPKVSYFLKAKAQAERLNTILKAECETLAHTESEIWEAMLSFVHIDAIIVSLMYPIR